MDSITIEVDSAGVELALRDFGPGAQSFVNAASKETAERVAAEYRARLARQLGPHATGAAVAAIHVRPAYDGNGWIVIAELPTMPNLPLWLEKGTTHMTARAAFYASIALEINAHQQRLNEALTDATRATGLGDSNV